MEAHDYTVVRAGSSSYVIASRISEDADARVLLIEALEAGQPSKALGSAHWPAPESGCA